MYGTRRQFPYFQCLACETLQISEIPESLSDYYPKQYYSFAPTAEKGLVRKLVNWASGMREASYVLDSPVVRRVFTKLLPPVEHTLLTLASLKFAGARRESRLLDVGCGGATLLHRLSCAGFHRLAGADPFIEKEIRYKTGLRVLKQPIDEVPGEFDLITFHHSLEHLVDPVLALKAARDRLVKGGKILVRVPTISSEAWDIYGIDWVQLDAPRHLYLFSRLGLRQMAATAGLDVLGGYDDSTAVQFLGSEQYRRDIPLVSETSFLSRPKRSMFSPAQVLEYSTKAKSLNAQERGDQLVLILGLKS